MKKLQIVFSDEAWAVVENVHKNATEDFEMGSISYSDVMNEIVLTSNVDIRTLQSKHTDIRRSLRALASQKDVNIDDVIRSLNEIRGKSKKPKGQLSLEVKHD